MVLRGIAVQLNSRLTAPKIGRPLGPARHMASPTASMGIHYCIYFKFGARD